jgi:hypothetical protein
MKPDNRDSNRSTDTEHKVERRVKREGRQGQDGQHYKVHHDAAPDRKMRQPCPVPTDCQLQSESR